MQFSSVTSEDKCRYDNLSGFLKRKCETEKKDEVYSCPGNHTDFWQIQHKFVCRDLFPIKLWTQDTCYFLSDTCKDETLSAFQMCGLDEHLNLEGSNHCGFICRTSRSNYTVFPHYITCDTYDDCADGSDEDSTLCSEENINSRNFENCTFDGYTLVPNNTSPPRCDESYMVCGGGFHFNDEVNCSHETGKQVSEYQEYTEPITPKVSLWWLHPNYVCENDTKFYTAPDCYEGGNNTRGIHCTKFGSNDTIYLPNFKMCTNPKLSDTANDVRLCEGWKEQMNCTLNQKRVALSCHAFGFQGLTTITEYLICGRGENCEDGIDEACRNISYNCKLHRHRICDGIKDCSYNEDEVNCPKQVTKYFKCKRKLHRKGIQSGSEYILTSWIMDGKQDCVDGKDEQESQWRNCSYSEGDNIRTIYIEKEEKCKNFYKMAETAKLLNQRELCDNIQSFSQESKLCEVSRGFIETKTIINLKNDIRYLAPCLDGLEIVHTSCSNSIIDKDRYIWGVEAFVWRVNRIGYDCKWLHGSFYNVIACLGLCKENLPCTLSELTASRCFKNLETAATSVKLKNTKGDLIKVRYGNNITNDLFECGNGNCIPSNLVCNLADDCGDGSDENISLCRNQFVCTNSEERLTLDKVCNGIVDCKDASDECSSECISLNIINIKHLKNFAWIIGTLSVIINLIVIVNSSHKLKNMDYTSLKFRDTSLITLIAVGDFLVGLYLLLIAVADSVHGDRYCAERFLWLGSFRCQFLGIVSSIGSQISLFTMTALSLFRLQRICNLIASNRFTVKSCSLWVISVLLILSLSILISILPNFPILEDYFINGLNYPDVTLFIGNVNKDLHLGILQAHFGRIKSIHMSYTWKSIRGLVQEMFSDEPGKVVGQGIGFYGNAGVCLFKYFVSDRDPQKYFSLGILMVNICCFFIITAAYVIVLSVSRNISHAQQDGNFNNKLQRKISLIILSDGLCWIPFIALGMANFFRIMDATNYYEFCSIVILPINSLINPVIYHSEFRMYWRKIELIFSNVKSSRSQANNQAISQSRSQHEVRSSHINEHAV